MQNSDAQQTDTLIIGAGQAGLAMSYWLSRAGVEHVLLDRRTELGGAWQDRWDGFYLNTPNFSIDLPGMPYDGPEPEAFMPRDDVVSLFRRYAQLIGAPVRTGTDVTRVSPADDGFAVETNDGGWRARNVVLATGAFQVPRIPTLAVEIPAHIFQLHSHEYRNPGQLPDGAVLIVGTAQSGGQIAEELHAAGRQVHLAVSSCPEAPRRYRGHDLIHWILNLGIHGPEYGLNAFRTEQLPSPAARFACNPLLSGTDGGHAIHLRDLGRQGMRLHGHFEAVHDGGLVFTDDLPERLAAVEAGFGQRMQPLFDAYIAAAGISAPPAEPARVDDWLPETSSPRVDLAAENITTVLWATGYKLDMSIVDIPVLDEWDYPRHTRGVTEYPGLFAVGLPWLTGHYSPLLGGVGLDAEYLAGRIAERAAGGN
ncbi:flavin-containing monooxygenase [Arthrobacter cupressi]|uniref:Putative flavoprotein involved in K+ transport n=1 Tax=Arthrobacter cupressi TaxID=1045773 RepID=A0A1G8IEB2_9MICC|nr:NAD(P)/FAD-dependent oxidoreductase [Arthrobacter cupressi]NYD78994.1 putative flavoprotein involved in K+ transport [Arthrobacter cupressi]SDI17359.1 putative flavoprotein involved in K+ transport [Arthrobacter cupressi]